MSPDTGRGPVNDRDLRTADEDVSPALESYIVTPLLRGEIAGLAEQRADGMKLKAAGWAIVAESAFFPEEDQYPERDRAPQTLEPSSQNSGGRGSRDP